MKDGRPVFEQVLGPQWERLGAVVRRHYTMAPYSADHVCVHGTMDEVHHARWARMLMPLGRLFGALVPHAGRAVPIEVHYRCRPDDAQLHWDRIFRFEGRAPFHFRSRMALARGKGEVIEYVRFGLGLRLAVSAEDGALVFRDRGYVWRLFGGLHLPLPLGLLMGTAYVEERPDPQDGECFSMRMVLRHRWFGDVFRYSGRFRLPVRAPAGPGAARAAP